MRRDARLTRSCGKKHCACKVNCSQNSYIVFDQTLCLGSGSASSDDWVRNVTRWELGTNGSAGLDTLLDATWEPNTKTYGLLLHWWVESTVPPQSCSLPCQTRSHPSIHLVSTFPLSWSPMQTLTWRFPGAHTPPNYDGTCSCRSKCWWS